MILLLLSNIVNTYLDNSITSIASPTDKSWLEIWLPCICTVIGCVISAIAIVWTTSKQIRNTSLLYEKKTAKEELQTLRTTLAQYIAVINQNSGQLMKKTYISDEHKILEATLSILLNKDNEDEGYLLSSIKKFHSTPIRAEGVTEWVLEIEHHANIVITNYKNKNYESR